MSGVRLSADEKIASRRVVRHLYNHCTDELGWWTVFGITFMLLIGLAYMMHHSYILLEDLGSKVMSIFNRLQ